METVVFFYKWQKVINKKKKLKKKKKKKEYLGTREVYTSNSTTIFQITMLKHIQ